MGKVLQHPITLAMISMHLPTNQLMVLQHPITLAMISMLLPTNQLMVLQLPTISVTQLFLTILKSLPINLRFMVPMLLFILQRVSTLSSDPPPVHRRLAFQRTVFLKSFNKARNFREGSDSLYN